MFSLELTEPIPITRKHDRFALVDIDSAEEMGQFAWSLHNTGYARAVINGKITYMHRLINKTPDGLMTDHINGNRLDNRKANLRTCTQYQNQNNIHQAKGYEAVGRRFYVRVYHNNHRYDFGRFDEEKLAEHIYWDIKDQLKEAVWSSN